MGRSTGLEPATSGTTNRRSNQLSYDRHTAGSNGTLGPSGAGGSNRSQRILASSPLSSLPASPLGRYCRAVATALPLLAMTSPSSPVDRSVSGADHTEKRLSAVAGIRRTPSAALTQFILPRFLSSDECAALCASIDRGVRPSTIADDIGDAAFRTSMTCDLDYGDPLVASIDARLCELAGIGPAFGEPLQGQRYDPGQEFKFHTDYFEPGGSGYIEHCTVSGQRTWTMMVYLNEPEAGGGTRFKATGKIIRPHTGRLVAWDNLTAAGLVNPATLHHGMKVRKGRKYIITKWFRERRWPWPEG